MISPNWYPSERQLRQFGYISLVGFGLIGLIVRYSLGSPPGAIALWSLGVLTFAAGLARPRLVLPVFLLMTALTLPIGWLVGQVVLRGLYFGVLTPLGLLHRRGSSAYLRSCKPSADTYWLLCEQRRDPRTYYRQG